MQQLTKNKKIELINYLKKFCSENRQQLITKNLSNRTRHLTTVLENIYQPQNASAVVRSCECFGVQDLHIIENDNSFRTSRGVVLGSAKWVNIHRHKKAEHNTEACLNTLKNQDYKLVATTLQPGSKPIDEIDLTQKTALLFGAEEKGLSEIAHNMADEMAYIPMVGFTQSLNISVSAAICLYTLTKQLRTNDINWPLTDDEKLELEIEWLIKSTQNGRIIAESFLS
jgi:tRNA (guanosine-2'-O-)-methyltransferase